MKENVIIITGANGNLGKATVDSFLDIGKKVVGMVHRKKAESVPVSNYHEQLIDLTDAGACEKCVHEIISNYGGIDAAVLTAGGFTMGDIAHTSTADLFEQYRLNFETAYNIARPVLIQMKKQGNGKIIFIGSQAGENTHKGAGVTAYSLSKSLLFQLANIINAEVKSMPGISAEMIVPSIIDTPQNRAAMPDADFSKWQTPLALAQQIRDIALHP